MNTLPVHRLAQSRLGRVLRPRSIAVFGGLAAAEAVRQLDKIGFTGDIWPVHPHHSEICGRRAFQTVQELPGVADVAFVGVNRHASIGIVAALAEGGAGGAVMFASGYAEAGAEGAALQASLCAAAGDLPFFGPNCYGFINYFDRVLVWPDQHGGSAVPRGVAIITQSGNIGLNLTMQRRALPIGYLITLGNQAGVDHAASIHAVLDDPRVTAIGLHMEAVANAEGLAGAIARAHAQGVPVVALKAGRSAAGADIAMSHTASLASEDRVVDAFFRRIGLARVHSIPALLETLKLLHVFGKLPGSRIASLSCSGGEAAVIADTAEDAGVQFVALDAAARAGLAATLPDLVSISNPMDYHTFGWRNRPALAATFAAMMRAGADLNLLILDFPRPDRCATADWDIAAAAMEDAAQAEGCRAAIVATLPEAMPEIQAAAMAARGIVPLFGLRDALDAIAAAAQAGPQVGVEPLAFDAGSSCKAELLSEWDGKCRLRAFGVVVPEGRMVTRVDDAVRAAVDLGLPVVAKAVGADLAHKTELGAVRLNLSADHEVAEAARALLGVRGKILVERMVRGCVAELIVGVARDPALGLYLMLGSGGILAELVGDSATLMVPAARPEIETALLGLRVAKLLVGHRGGRRGDIGAAIEAVIAIQAFALAHRDLFGELEVNPLMVCETGCGAVAVDVLMRMVPDVAHG